MAPISLLLLTARSNEVNGCPAQTSSECNSPLPGAPSGPTVGKPNLVAARIVFSVVVIVVVFIVMGVWILVRLVFLLGRFWFGNPFFGCITWIIIWIDCLAFWFGLIRDWCTGSDG